MSESLQYKCCRFPITTSSKSLSPRVSSPYISKSQQWRVRPNQFKPGPLHCATSIRRQPKSLPVWAQAPSATRKPNACHVHSLVPTRSCLTSHSTGPIAACRHLGYKSLAQIPSRHNGPVSSNVRHLNPEESASARPLTFEPFRLLCALRPKIPNTYSFACFGISEAILLIQVPPVPGWYF